jgi:citrate lyase subunit beta/citryl-CoA lyase
MNVLVRRSNLLMRAGDVDGVKSAWQHNADAITLDIAGAGTAVRDAIASCAQGGAEVFVRAYQATLRADLEAAVWPGLRGVMLASVVSAAQVKAADEIVTALERERGLVSGAVQLIIVLDTARAVWDVREIVTASARISQLALDEQGLAADLGITPSPEIDPFDFARGRVIVEAIAAKVMPVGIAYPLSVAPRVASFDEVHALAMKGKNLGFKGVLCPHAEWVAPVNAAFTPTPELVHYNQRVRVAFAAGVAAGTAAVPLDGKMIDVPVDEWAIVVLATAEACAARDAEKQTVMSALTNA